MCLCGEIDGSGWDEMLRRGDVCLECARECCVSVCASMGAREQLQSYIDEMM